MKKLIYCFIVFILYLICSSHYSIDENIFLLTNQERAVFLEYYSPIIFKRADENTRPGHDWISNYYFDGDPNFSNNSKNWKKLEDHFDDSNWNIRPTLYSSIIEFMNPDNTKSLILFYNIYHPRNGKNNIHDWERLEIRIDNVNPNNKTPGNNERINYVVITQHSKHNEPTDYSSKNINFYTPPNNNGKHILIWQAEWTSSRNLRKNELHYVEDSWNSIMEQKKKKSKAKVNINGSGHSSTNFHYIFAYKNSILNAKVIKSNNKGAYDSGKDVGKSIEWEKVKTLQYELQDIADIIETHWDGSPRVKNCSSQIPDKDSYANWKGECHKVVIETPMKNENGDIVISVGTQNFRTQVVNILNNDDSKKGLLSKHWFWGRYEMDSEESSGGVKEEQHWYKTHIRSSNKDKNSTSSKGKYSGKLPNDWHKESKGGFDGRWVQLFKD